MAAERSFFLSLDSHRGANISMSRAVFTSFFPHFLFYSYIISFSRIIVKSKMRLLPSKKGSRVEVF